MYRTVGVYTMGAISAMWSIYEMSKSSSCHGVFLKRGGKQQGCLDGIPWTSQGKSSGSPWVTRRRKKSVSLRSYSIQRRRYPHTLLLLHGIHGQTGSSSQAGGREYGEGWNMALHMPVSSRGTDAWRPPALACARTPIME